MFAIIETGGSQYKVEKGTKLDINRIEGKEEETVIFKEVLLLNSDKETKIGTPIVENATVTAKIVEQKRGEKIKVFKMKPKKRYQKTQGHRQELTTVEITDISESGAKKTTEKKAPVKKTPTKKSPAKETSVKKTQTKKAPAKKKSPTADQKTKEK